MAASPQPPQLLEDIRSFTATFSEIWTLRAKLKVPKHLCVNQLWVTVKILFGDYLHPYKVLCSSESLLKQWIGNKYATQNYKTQFGITWALFDPQKRTLAMPYLLNYLRDSTGVIS